jgi:hypothetical protein
MNSTGLTDADFDEKLREMGNYLWDLEQEADRASADGRQPLVEEFEAKILRQANRAQGAIKLWPRLSPVSGIGCLGAGRKPPIIFFGSCSFLQ